MVSAPFQPKKTANLGFIACREQKSLNLVQLVLIVQSLTMKTNRVASAAQLANTVAVSAIHHK